MSRDFAVVGAGLAGLAAAGRLAGAGRDVTVIEKSGAPGGRCATRLRHGLAFDHGAPFAQVTLPAFREVVADWAASGHAAHWPDGDTAVGLPGMRGLAAPMAGTLEIAWGSRVSGLERTGTGWRLAREDAAPVTADCLVLAIPGPQAAALLPEGVSVTELDAVAMEPCWTVMAAFDHPLPGPAVVDGESAPLARAIRDSGKPGRAHEPEAWVLHADAAWTRAHLDDPADAVADHLLAALAQRLSHAMPAPATRMVHRWLYARVSRPLGRPFHWDPALGLGLAGDWCAGPGLEAAWQSGRTLAERILAGE